MNQVCHQGLIYERFMTIKANQCLNDRLWRHGHWTVLSLLHGKFVVGHDNAPGSLTEKTLAKTWQDFPLFKIPKHGSPGGKFRIHFFSFFSMFFIFSHFFSICLNYSHLFSTFVNVCNCFAPISGNFGISFSQI